MAYCGAMRSVPSRRLQRTVRTAGLALLLSASLHTVAPGPNAAVAESPASLHALFSQLEPTLADNAFGAPIHLETERGDGRFTSSVYAIVDHSFDATAERLADARGWCDIVSLHLNVKACTHTRSRGEDELVLYLGRKFYQPPDDSMTQLEMRFEPFRAPGALYFLAVLESDEGPLGTSDYRLALDAIPVDSQRTFLRFRYGYRYGQLASSTLQLYFWTLGRGKVGFSREPGGGGRVAGLQGVLERNAMRYHLAIVADLETAALDPREPSESRAARWFDLTERYHDELYELPRGEYLENKRRELEEQRRLQTSLDAGERVAAAPIRKLR